MRLSAGERRQCFGGDGRSSPCPTVLARWFWAGSCLLAAPWRYTLRMESAQTEVLSTSADQRSHTSGGIPAPTGRVARSIAPDRGVEATSRTSRSSWEPSLSVAPKEPLAESQLRNKKARAYLKAYRLRQRLGGSKPVIHPIPERPYRMWRKTYNWIVAEIERLERPLYGSPVVKRAPLWIRPLSY